MKNIACTIILISIFACEPKESENCHPKITFVNISDDGLYVFTQNDTVLSQYSPDPRYDPDTPVFPQSINNTALIDRGAGTSECYESRFNYSQKLIVFAINAEVLNNNSWEFVKENYLVAKRYDLSLNDLRNQNWTIYYP